MNDMGFISGPTARPRRVPLTPVARAAWPVGARHLGGMALGLMALAWTPAASAQTDACDQLRTSLAGRLSADPRSYTLEAVPAGTPLPAGGKFIGNCKGGAWKILYRKGQHAPIGSSAVKVAVPVAAVAAPSSSPVAPRSASAPSTTAVSAAVATMPASASATPAALSGARSGAVASAGAPVPVPMAARASAPALSGAAMGPPAPSRRAPVEAPAGAMADRAIDRTAVRPGPAARTVPLDAVADEARPWRPQDLTDPPSTEALASDPSADIGERWSARMASGVTQHWPWVAPLLAVPMLLLGWMWFAQRRYYDKAGLPRGPRL